MYVRGVLKKCYWHIPWNALGSEALASLMGTVSFWIIFLWILHPGSLWLMELSPYKMTCQAGSNMRFSTSQTWQFRMEELMGVICLVHWLCCILVWFSKIHPISWCHAMMYFQRFQLFKLFNGDNWCRYNFKEDGEKCNLQEIGPRFTMKCRRALSWIDVMWGDCLENAINIAICIDT